MSLWAAVESEHQNRADFLLLILVVFQLKKNGSSAKLMGDSVVQPTAAKYMKRLLSPTSHDREPLPAKQVHHSASLTVSATLKDVWCGGILLRCLVRQPAGLVQIGWFCISDCEHCCVEPPVKAALVRPSCRDRDRTQPCTIAGATG